MDKKILHIDVNNAFLSWTALNLLEQGYETDIREIPAVIGGDENSRHGIVLAKSNIAKKFGIVTGEPIYFAKQKCNGLKIYPGDFSVYKYYSNKLYNILLEYTDKIERYSIDECFLDLTEYTQNKKLEDIAKEIQERVNEELKFTVNIGLSSNKLLAKMASDFEKPNKIHTLYLYEIEDKMWPLPVKELFMLGKKTVPKLYNMQIKTIGDLARSDKNTIVKKFGKHGLMMWEYANGIDNSDVVYKEELPKSVGNSVTLPKDFYDIEEIYKVIIALTEQVTYRLRKYDLLANVVCVQLRTKDFKDYSHQKKLSFATSSTKEILKVAKEVLYSMYNKEAVRLIGVRVDNLESSKEVQLNLFSNDTKQNKLDNVLDNIKDKYGYTSITRAGKLDVENIVKGKEKKN